MLKTVLRGIEFQLFFCVRVYVIKGLKELLRLYIVKEASTLTHSEDGRVVKATVLRSVREICVGSIPTPRTKTYFEIF